MGSRYSSRDLKVSRGYRLWIWGYRRDTMNQTVAVYRDDIYSFPCATNLFWHKEICLIALIWAHCVSLGRDPIQWHNLCRQKWTISHLENCALLCYYAASNNYHYSLRNNSEVRSSHLLRDWSLKSRISREELQSGLRL